MELQSSLDNIRSLFLNSWLKSFEMTSEKCIVDQEQTFIIWNGDRNSPEMSLISWINKE